MLDDVEFDRRMREDGWALIPDAADAAIVARINAALEEAHAECDRLRREKGLSAGTDGSVHHLVAFGGVFLDFLEHLPAEEYVASYFGRPYILNSFGGVTTTAGSANYTHNIHRDVRSFTRDIHLMLNMLVMLDDFTLENGATHLFTGSHKENKKPADAALATSGRAVGKAGTVLLFDSNLWHAAGVNHTGAKRRCVTLTFTPPFLKQQADYPRMVGYTEGEGLSSKLRQLLGFKSRVPASLDEWYQPPEKRFYQRDQEPKEL